MSEASASWVDANVLLRFLSGQPPEMAESASRILEEAERGEISLRVHPVVVAETVWVLQSFYEYSREEIAGSLVPLLTEHGLKVEGPRVVSRALESMAAKNVDFADALLAETGKAQNEGVTSFDADFKKLGVEWREP
ncbi:MAG: PIN domain-containing protein [Rubrobacter sp.]